MPPIPTLADLNLLLGLPVYIIAAGMCALLLIDLWVPNDRKTITAWLAQGTLVTAFVANLFLFNTSGVAFGGLFIADNVTAFLNMTILITTFIVILLSMDYLQRTGTHRGEYYSLLLLSAAGAMFMVGAGDLVTIFVALELLSIPLYVMAAFRYPDAKSEESGLKYFILGAFAGAFYVYGAALVFGATGHTRLAEIFTVVRTLFDGTVPAGASPVLLLLGSGLILVGLGFKVAVFPFHMWTPDVYEGAPTPVTAFMSVAAKVGGFAALVRIFAVGLPLLSVEGAPVADWQLAVALVSALTMILGNFAAITQTHLKRMLAYSSIAHAGYILMALAAAGTQGVASDAATALNVYLLAYAFTNLGAFAVVMSVEKDDASGTQIDDLVGLSRSQPLLAACMAVFMLSLIGIPLTGGFIGKYLVFASAIRADLFLLAVVGVLTSVVSAFYYARVIIAMYLRQGEGDPAEGATPYVHWAVYVALAGTVILGVAPALITGLSQGVAVAGF